MHSNTMSLGIYKSVAKFSEKPNIFHLVLSLILSEISLILYGLVLSKFYHKSRLQILFLTLYILYRYPNVLITSSVVTTNSPTNQYFLQTTFNVM